jgi:hypothetical protein
MTENEVRITLRLPKDLHGDIIELNERYKTSLNGQIVTMLRDWFSSDRRFSELERRIETLEGRVPS